MEEHPFKDKAALLQILVTLSKDKLTLFEYNSHTSGKDMLLIPLGSYQEVMDLILYLLKTCIMALQVEYVADKYIGNPEINTSEVLKFILQLIPYEEMEFLDEVQAMLKQVP